MQFLKANYTQMEIALQTNELVGLFQTDYIEDAQGNDGQLSFISVATGIDSPFPVSVVNNELSGCLLRGRVNISTIAIGVYNVRGLVKDAIGNLSPILQEIEIKEGYEVNPVIGKLTIMPQLNYDKTTILPRVSYSKITRIPRYVATKRLRIPA